MKKKALIALILIALLVGGVSVLTSINRSKSHNALAAYKAELRAQGEKLTFEEAGYPFPLETNSNLENFVLLSDRLGSISDIPGSLIYMQSSAPGKALVSWASARPCSVTSRSLTNEWRGTWEELATDCKSAADTLAEIRLELEHPPARFLGNYTNPFSFNPRNPFVQKRKAAQFLAADSLSALHEHQLSRVQTNFHALTRLAQVHRADPALVSAMIRIAISGLGLAVTWESLSADGWDETSLLALQRDWEAIDLIQALETGFVGERLFGERAFELVRQANPDEQAKMMQLPSGYPIGVTPGVIVKWRDQLFDRSALMYWRGHADEDEIFYLNESEIRVQSIRKLKANASGAGLKIENKAHFDELVRALDSPLGKYRHFFSARLISSFSRAFDTVVRNEMQRRMTITAIALKRFHLQNGRYPAALGELVPQFVAAELMDPWSGKPFHYRLNTDGTFTLYSVGEDGLDDGGDPNSAKSTSAPSDMSMGKDVVWPTPVFPEGLNNGIN